MQSNIGFIPWSKSTLKINGGKLTCLYDSDKWEFGRKQYKNKNWKKYRKEQYKYN